MMDDVLAAAAQELDAARPEDVLRWATERLPRVGFATGLGVEGCVVVDLIGRHSLPVDVFTLDTGLLFPQTYELRRRLEAHSGVTIRAVRPALGVEEQAEAHGPALWVRDPDACCQLRKLDPLASVMRGLDGWISAIRRDQTPERSAARTVERDRRWGIVKINPLARWTTKEVWRYIHDHNVPYNPLHDEGYPSIGCQPCTTPVTEGEDPRAGRWRGQAKRECGLHLSAKETSR